VKDQLAAECRLRRSTAKANAAVNAAVTQASVGFKFIRAEPGC
jgi:hypothetical protein